MFAKNHLCHYLVVIVHIDEFVFCFRVMLSNIWLVRSSLEAPRTLKAAECINEDSLLTCHHEEQ